MPTEDPEYTRESRRAELRKWTDQQIIRYWRTIKKKAGLSIDAKMKTLDRMRTEIIDYEFPTPHDESND